MVKSKVAKLNSSGSSTIVHPIFTIIMLALLYYTYHYLVKLENCVCIHGNATGEERADLQKLRYIELFFIAVAVLGLVALYFFKYDMNQLAMKSILGIAYIILLLVIYVYLVSNVLKLYRNMPSSCECAIQWPRYYLYLQGFLASIVLFMYAFVIVVGLLALLYFAAYGKK